MNTLLDWRDWRHLTKLDPDKELTDEQLDFIVHSGTDALIIGGTQRIDSQKTASLWKRLAPYSLPKVLEVTFIQGILSGADLYFIPMALNAGDPYWLSGAHHQAVKTYGPFINWDKLIPEGYIILNPDSAAAKLTKAIPSEQTDASAYAVCGEMLMNLPIIYLEYSGTYGDPGLVKHVRNRLQKSRLFYGGGIDSAEKAYEMGLYADTIVVGNMLYEGKLELLPETVAAVKNSRAFAVKRQAN